MIDHKKGDVITLNELKTIIWEGAISKYV